MEHAAAVRAVNAAFARLAHTVREQVVIGHDGLEAEIDAAIADADRERALAAIAAWKRHWLATFEEATR